MAFVHGLDTFQTKLQVILEDLHLKDLITWFSLVFNKILKKMGKVKIQCGGSHSGHTETV
jgi:hypothetical protein